MTLASKTDLIIFHESGYTVVTGLLEVPTNMAVLKYIQQHQKEGLSFMSGQANKHKRYFSLKGKNAEQVLSDLAEKTFFADWCFLNPQLPNGKELCDLLVVFSNVAIIWQVKDLKLDKDGSVNSREVQKNLKQLAGARRQLFEIKTPIELYNSRRRRETFDPSLIDEVHLISALMGEEGDAMNMVETIKNQSAHVLTKAFLPILLEELDTIRDFCQYLAAREAVVSENRLGETKGREQDLLAYYLLHGRSFGRPAGKVINIREGLWDQFRNSSAYQRKKEADEISYLWDETINRVHEVLDNPPYPEAYERVARVMAWPDRLYRRMLSDSFADAKILADSIPPTQKKDQIFRRVVPTPFGVTYCFLFYDISPYDDSLRETRFLMLQALCHVVRGVFPQNTVVIGIGTEMTIKDECAFDFVGLEIPVWTSEDEKRLKNYQSTYNFLSNIKVFVRPIDEYPPEEDLI
jgi:hypothetical protein